MCLFLCRDVSEFERSGSKNKEGQKIEDVTKGLKDEEEPERETVVAQDLE